MKIASSGWASLVVLAGLVLSVAVVGGFVVAEDQPSGEAILSEVETSYQNADSTVVDATVETEYEDKVRTFAIHSVATKSGQMRINVSNERGYLVVGTTGNESWVAGTRLATPLVLSGDGFTSHMSVEGGAVNVIGENFSAQAFGNETNSTQVFGEKAVNESIVTHMKTYGIETAGYEAFLSNHTAGPADTERALAESKWANWSVSRTLEETNLTAERIKTVTEDSTELHVVDVSAPAEEGTLRLWVSANDWTVEKQELHTPNGTVTVEMDTQFNVSPTASTFQPPSPMDTEHSTDTIDDLQMQAPNPLAVPGENWTFTQGSVVDRPVSLTAAQYTNENRNLTVLQYESKALSGMPGEGRTVTVSARNVTITDLSGTQSEGNWMGMDDGVLGQWTENDQTIVIAGRLSESELVEVIESIDVDGSET